MDLSHLIAGIAERAWGLRDKDYSAFLVSSAQKKLVLDRNSLDRLILSRLKGVIHHAQQTSAYYANAFNNYGVSVNDIKSLDDIKRFPCLTRKVLRERLPELISGGTILPSWRKSATGGTTSSPVVFYCDDKALWQKNAFTKAIDMWYGRRTGDRVAYFWGAPQDISGRTTVGMHLRNISYNRFIMLPSVPLDDQMLESHYQKLLYWQPTFMQAYPTPLYELCLYLQKHSLHVPSLRAISVTAETLLQEHRELIESTFGFQIYNWYGSRELGRVASECECHDGLHINEPCVYVEIEADPALPDGFGHLIVTDLLNKATPFIRYRTGDIACFMEGDCSCNRSLRKIGSLTGRVTDLITLHNGRKIRYSNQLDNRQIKELQVVQKSYNHFMIKYVKGPDFGHETLDSFYKSFCVYLGKKVKMSFEETIKIPRERSGKVRLVINEMTCVYASESQSDGGVHD